MINFLYSIIIYPARQIIELCYYLINWFFRNEGLSIIGISIAVGVITLPLYNIAEKHQKNERDIQKILKPKIDKIKAVFSGDERFMLLSVLYRQNHYHPVYILRSSFGLLIQIPFFIAAYSFLSNLNTLTGVSFLFIKNLSSPDNLLFIGNFPVNILPLLMTVINIISSSIYSRGFSQREKIQLYGMAIIFLVLLYSSPSCMVLYWTMNNIFSLGKNIIKSKPNKNKLFIFLFIAIFVFVEIFLLFLHNGKPITRLLIGVSSLILFSVFSTCCTIIADGVGEAFCFVSLRRCVIYTNFVIPPATQKPRDAPKRQAATSFIPAN